MDDLAGKKEVTFLFKQLVRWSRRTSQLNLTKEKLLFVCKSGRDITVIFDLN